MATLHLHDVRKAYAAGQPVIHGVNLDVADGEFIVIVGPSGCGKSTLLRMVAGLETITGGEIRIGSRVVNTLEPAERDVAMVFQNYALYPHMSVYDNMAYGLRIRKFSRAQIDERVQQAARILGLEPYLQRRPRALSGGQRQRVAMGRAIVREPQLFLFDEPLSNLDAKLRVQMRLELQTLHRRLHTTSLYVTHDQVEAMTLADRMVVMNAGRAEQIGTPQDVFDRPASRFVAGFIGSPPMNLLEVDVDADGSGARTPEGVAVGLPPGAAPAALRGTRAVLGMRPEHLQVGARGVTLVVDMVETLGSEQLVHGRVGHQRCVVRQPTEGAARLAVDALVTAGVPRPTQLHWFSAADGRRVEHAAVDAAA